MHLHVLDLYLRDHSYLDGHALSMLDVHVCSKLTSAPHDASLPHLHRWHNHVQSSEAKRPRSFEAPSGVAEAAKATHVAEALERLVAAMLRQDVGVDHAEEVAGSIVASAVHLKDAEQLVVLNGAGMGVDSGIGTFRGRNIAKVPLASLLGLTHEQTSHADWWQVAPQVAWSVWAARWAAMVDRATPHAGYHLVEKWGRACPDGHFVITSNIDGHWPRVVGDKEAVVEEHGALTHVQPIGGESSIRSIPKMAELMHTADDSGSDEDDDDDGTVVLADAHTMRRLYEATPVLDDVLTAGGAVEVKRWPVEPAAAADVAAGRKQPAATRDPTAGYLRALEQSPWEEATISTDEDGELRITPAAGREPIPRVCALRRPGESASRLEIPASANVPAERPAVYMFGQDVHWDNSRTLRQEKRYHAWAAPHAARASGLVVLEIGCGTHVKSMRNRSMELCRDQGAVLLRYNLDDYHVSDEDCADAMRRVGVGRIGAKRALELTDMVKELL